MDSFLLLLPWLKTAEDRLMFPSSGRGQSLCCHVSNPSGLGRQLTIQDYDTIGTQNQFQRSYRVATINLRNVPEDLHRRAKARASMEGVSLEQLMVRLLEEYLEGIC